MVGLRNFNLQNFESRVPNPGAVAYAQFKTPFKGSNLPGAAINIKLLVKHMLGAFVGGLRLEDFLGRLWRISFVLFGILVELCTDLDRTAREQ